MVRERRLIQNQINILLEKRAIETCQSKSDQFVSKIFLVPKPDGTHRVILNLKQLNEFVETNHFKLEDGKTVRRLLARGYFMASIDLKDAYYLINVKKSNRIFLRFLFQDKLYQFTCLPFGLNQALYTFTKLMKPVITYLRKRGYLSVIDLDDILLLGKSYNECFKIFLQVQATCQLLERLGFIINRQKSELVPSTRCVNS